MILKVFYIMCALGIQARMITSPRQARLSSAEPRPSYYFTNIDGHPGTYAFGYDVQDPHTGNTQFRTEERYPNGTVIGSYGYVDVNGRPHNYRYVADEKGYRIMTDALRQPVIPHHIQPDANVESSVTWSRPKKLNRNNPNKSYLTKLPIRRKNDRQSERLQSPSFYGSYT